MYLDYEHVMTKNFWAFMLMSGIVSIALVVYISVQFGNPENNMANVSLSELEQLEADTNIINSNN